MENKVYMNSKSFSKHQFTDFEDKLLHNYVRYLTTYGSFRGPLVYMLLALVLIGVTIWHIMYGEKRFGYLSAFVFSGILLLGVIQIVSSIKDMLRISKFQKQALGKDAVLRIYDGSIKGFPVVGKYNRCLVVFNKPVEDETKGEVGAETSLENSAESAISSGTENPVNDNEEEKGAGNNKFISTPEMATISKDFFLDISDDEAIDAYILELSYSNTQTYFAYPAKYFE